MRFPLRSVLVAITAGALLVTACSSGSDADPSETLPPLEAESAAAFNDADVAFARDMIPHHRAAIEMADMALASEARAGAEIQALATQIKGAQDPEIEQMTNLLESWGQPVDMPGMDDDDMPGMDDDDMDGMDDSADADGMMSEQEMEALGTLSGPDFDVAWAAAMIEHHEGAVSMALMVQSTGSSSEIMTLADAIITGQQAEIDEMNAFTEN